MLEKSLGYAINKYGRSSRVPEKIVIFKKIKNYIQAMNLSSGSFINNFYWYKTMTIVEKMAKKLGFCRIV